MKILIIEDEQPAAQELTHMLEQMSETYRVVAALQSNESLIEWKKNNEWPDLILSDIELLDGPVFATYKQLNPTAPIIFTTAYEHYMANAFETNGIGYLLKPFNESELSEALKKYHRLRPTIRSSDFESLMRSFKSLSAGAAYKSRFTIKKGNGMYLLEVSDITSLKVQHGVLRLYDLSGLSHLVSMTLAECMHQLDPARFFQVNRGEGVALAHIERMENYGRDRLAIFVKGQSEPLISSVSKTPEFRKWLEGASEK